MGNILHQFFHLYLQRYICVKCNLFIFKKGREKGREVEVFLREGGGADQTLPVFFFTLTPPMFVFRLFIWVMVSMSTES